MFNGFLYISFISWVSNEFGSVFCSWGPYPTYRLQVAYLQSCLEMLIAAELLPKLAKNNSGQVLILFSTVLRISVKKVQCVNSCQV